MFTKCSLCVPGDLCSCLIKPVITSSTNKETKSGGPSWFLIILQQANNGTGFKTVTPFFLYFTSYSPLDYFSAD